MGPQLGRIGIDSYTLVVRLSAYHAWLLVSTKPVVYTKCMPFAFTVRSVTQEPLFLCPRPELRQEHPLNLSISISGGKETNQDAPSNGE